jgi:ABC-type phosphate transport system permease subunit
MTWPERRNRIVNVVMFSLTGLCAIFIISNRFWSPGWNSPTASLPVMIFTYAIAPYDDWHRQAWAAGFVLLMLVLLTNIIARITLRRRHY